MKNIIIFTTKHGSVEKAAKRLEAKLDGEVCLVNLMREKSPALDEFDRVILGGSIYAGRVQKKLSGFILGNVSQLVKKRVGLFICAAQPEPASLQELQAAFPSDLFEHAVVKEVFGYEYDFAKLNLLEKLATRAIAGVTSSKFELSDEKIDIFAKTICATESN